MSQENSLRKGDFRKLFSKAQKLGWEAKCLPDENQLGSQVFPDPANIFRALEIISPSKVRFVILGQDPYPASQIGYPNRPIATGIAFGVDPDHIAQRRVHSSCAIYKVLAGIYGTNPGTRAIRYASSSLIAWATEHKILMLNVALTIPKNGTPGDHIRHWQNFTQHIITQARNGRAKPTVISWGNIAADTAKTHKLISVPHPSARNGGFKTFWETDIGRSLRAT